MTTEKDLEEARKKVRELEAKAKQEKLKLEAEQKAAKMASMPLLEQKWKQSLGRSAEIRSLLDKRNMLRSSIEKECQELIEKALKISDEIGIPFAYEDDSKRYQYIPKSMTKFKGIDPEEFDVLYDLVGISADPNEKYFHPGWNSSMVC